MFIYLIIIRELFLVVKVYWLFIVYGIVNIMLFSFIHKMFNFSIDNEVGKPNINNRLFFYLFLSSLWKIVREEDSSLALEISIFMMILL